MGNSQRKYYTYEEIENHGKVKSSWIICDNKVYDVTNYIAVHPGGSNSIFKYSGTRYDCKNDMKKHSKMAKKLLDKYLIGYIKI